MGVFNRRNAIAGWVSLKFYKRAMRRKAKRMWNPLARLQARREGKGSRR